MAETDHFGLSKFGPGSALSDEGYKILGSDRDLIDRLLWLAVQHEHTGGAGSGEPPATGPTLSLDTTDGALPAGTRIWYGYTFVDGNGLESALSPLAFVDTPPLVTAPEAPTLSFATTGGTLLPGAYLYVLTAYTGVNNQETAAENVAAETVTGSTATNTITLTLPTLPAGADGFNVYRKKPGGSRYLWVAAIDMSGTPPASWVDDGSADEDCDRTQPTTNTTESTNTVTVDIASVPAGYSWRLYRTMVSGQWTDSLVATLPGATLEYVDDGDATVAGTPPSTSQTIPTPGKVDLTDMNQVEGRLPLSAVSAFPVTIPFVFEGDLVVMSGTIPWTCEFPKFRIVGVRAALGRGYMPQSDPVIVDVNRGASSATPTFSTVFTDQGTRPTVPVGDQRGARTVPQVVELVEGDMLTCDIDQTGGGVSPTDRDLIVLVYGFAYGWTDTDSMEW